MGSSSSKTPVESITPQGGPASARRTPPQQQQRGGGGRDRDEDEEDGGDVEAEDEDEEDLLEAAVDLLAAAGQKVESPHHHQGSMLRELRTLEMVPGNGHMDRLDPTQQEDIDVSGSGDEEIRPVSQRPRSSPERDTDGRGSPPVLNRKPSCLRNADRSKLPADVRNSPADGKHLKIRVELEQLEIAGGSPSRQAGSGSSASHKHSSSPGSSRRQHGASSQEHDLHRSGGEAECTDGGLLEKGARDERDESSHGEGEDEDEDEDEEDFHPSRLFQRVKSESSRENMLKDKDHSQSWLNTVIQEINADPEESSIVLEDGQGEEVVAVLKSTFSGSSLAIARKDRSSSPSDS